MNGCCTDKACTKATCMDLPNGKTCGDCVHIHRCRAFGYTSSESNTWCDFFPRRFHESTGEPKPLASTPKETP